MPIWSAEIKEVKNLLDSFQGQFPDLEKELKPLITSEDSNVVLLYSRRCLEVIVTELCEVELKRPRKTEPLKGIIDKLNSEEKVPSHIITSMHGLNSLSTYGAHPKDFDPEQVKPALNNLSIILKWYFRYNELQNKNIDGTEKEKEFENQSKKVSKEITIKSNKTLIVLFTGIILIFLIGLTLVKFNIIGEKIEKSVAVLPFRNFSPDDSTQYFMDGVMEELLTNLQRIKDLRVLSRTSVEQYRDQNKTIPQIAKELGVNYIVEGSGQKSGNSLRMRVQLISANKERHLWANSFEQDTIKLQEYFKTQAEFAEKIANELKAVITSGEQKLLEKIPTKRLEAYEAYLQGMFHVRKLTLNDLEIGMKYFELAKEKDPDFALAHAGIGFTWLGLVQMGFASPEDAGPKGIAALETAFKLDSTIDQIHYMTALAKVWSEWDWKGGESELLKTLALNPNHAEARAYYSHFLHIMGRPKEAMEQIEMALKLDPVSPLIKALYSADLFFVRQYDAAVKVSSDALKMEPSNPVALSIHIFGLHFTGKYNEALKEMKSYYPYIYSGVINASGTGNSKEEYFKWLKLQADTLAIQSINIFIMPSEICYLYSLAGDIDKGIEWLEQAYKMRDQSMPYLLFPCLDNLRNDKRFQDISLKMNLPYKSD